MVDIFNDAWSQNWGFAPLTFDEMKSMADTFKLILPPDATFVVELDGAPQAFGVVIPNLLELTAATNGRLLTSKLPGLIRDVKRLNFRTGRLALFGVRRALHRSVTGGAVVMAFIEELRRRGQGRDLDSVEFGWVLEDNAGMRRPIELAGAKIDKIHRVYEKAL